MASKKGKQKPFGEKPITTFFLETSIRYATNHKTTGEEGLSQKKKGDVIGKEKRDWMLPGSFPTQKVRAHYQNTIFGVRPKLFPRRKVKGNSGEERVAAKSLVHPKERRKKPREKISHRGGA